jgi:uncharacterized protein (TIGR04222 family)
MNPFDLPGPQFLLFYLALVVVVQLAWRPLLRLLGQPADDGAHALPPPALGSLDPYLVAYLRGQETETARVAIISLLDRGLLRAEGENLTAAPGNEGKVGRPLEREILRAFATSAKAATIFKHAGFGAACAGLRDELRRLGLLAGAGARLQIGLLRLVAVAVLAGVAITKIAVAIERGRSNFGFLVILGLIACIVTLGRASAQRTRRGDAYLEALQDRFAGLKDRAGTIKRGGATHELVVLAAIFGMASLPAFALADAEALFPRAMQNASGGGSCGSSCGSSSCGGSSCGGGGCGGGCGGCG